MFWRFFLKFLKNMLKLFYTSILDILFIEQLKKNIAKIAKW